MKAIRFDTDQGSPPLVAAASLALGLLRVTKTVTWADLVTDPGRLAAAGVEVSPDQVLLLNSHAEELAPLRVGPPMVTLAVCPECARWAVVSGGQPASTCSLTLGCTGKPVRASVAARAKDPV
jgi:hypothetical protein